MRVAALRSALSALADVPEGVIHLDSTYPMSRYLRAFDASVAAAGYNAYHELIRFGVPSLFVPMARQTDDQAGPCPLRRARAGSASAWTGPEAESLEAKLDELLDEGGRAGDERPLARAAPGERRRGGGGVAGGACDDRRGSASRGRQRWKRYAATRSLRARAAAPFAARVPGALGRIAHQTSTRPKARVLVDAGGSGPERGRRALACRQAIEAGGARRERVLVVDATASTLCPFCASRRRAGSTCSAPGRRELILAERPRIKRVVTLP